MHSQKHLCGKGKQRLANCCHFSMSIHNRGYGDVQAARQEQLW